jgi:hypothetical protein
VRLPAVLALIPPLSALALVLLFQVDVPVHDQWDLVPQMVRWSRGDTSLEEVWSPYGEHRMFLPRLLMLSMGVVSAWWIPLESLASVVFLAGVGVILARILASREDGSWWLIALVSLLALAPNRAEAYMWGWQLQVSMGLFFAVLALVLLSRSSERVLLAIPAGISALAASLCFGAAMAVWPAGLACLPRGRKELLPAAAAWLAPALLAVLLYLNPVFGSQSPGILADSFSVVAYSAVFLGAPLLSFAHRIPVVGLPVVAVLGAGGAVLALSLHRRQPRRSRLWAALGLLGIFSALLTAGAGQASVRPRPCRCGTYPSPL